MGATFSQFYPPSASLTEANLPDQTGKVFVVTGGYSGVGLGLVQILYSHGATVYIAGRSNEHGRNAIASIKDLFPDSEGSLEFLLLDLADLSTIKSSAEQFLAKEKKLDVLWNNAAVSLPPSGSLSAQGHELTIATNCLGPHLFTQLLLPTLIATAETAPAGTVRVVWASSLVVDMSAPKGGINLADLVSSTGKAQQYYYCLSKVGNYFLASELSNRVVSKNILSVTQNPGNLSTNLVRHLPLWMQWAVTPLLYPAKMGAYTELWTGLAPELTMQMGGGYVVPWGRIHPAPRADLVAALRPTEEGGTGEAEAFWGWCEERVTDFR